MTVKRWRLTARTGLSAYLQAGADNGNRAPDIDTFLPWTMAAARRAAMRAYPPVNGGQDARVRAEGFDTA